MLIYLGAAALRLPFPSVMYWSWHLWGTYLLLLGTAVLAVELAGRIRCILTLCSPTELIRRGKTATNTRELALEGTGFSFKNVVKGQLKI